MGLSYEGQIQDHICIYKNEMVSEIDELLSKKFEEL